MAALELAAVLVEGAVDLVASLVDDAFERDDGGDDGDGQSSTR